jgi:hypothetical protein
VLNGQTALPTGWAIPTFDLSNAPDVPAAGMNIGSTDVVECNLIVDETLRAEDWNDLYLLMDYEVGT